MLEGSASHALRKCPVRLCCGALSYSLKASHSYQHTYSAVKRQRMGWGLTHGTSG
jgi:hypothetical protein